MLLPLPGSSGHQCEQMPIVNPAAAIVGINTHDSGKLAGRASAMMRLNASPTASMTGANSRAAAVSRYDSAGPGQTRTGRSWVTAEPTATARLEVINAAPTARGCQVFSMMRRANNAPPSGTA